MFTGSAILVAANMRRLALALLGAITVLVGGASMAAAAEGDSDLGGAMSWIELEDRHGISVWQYNLNIHRGSAMAPWKFVWSLIIEIPWQIFRVLVAITTWLLRFTLEFTWLRAITAPFTTLADGIDSVLSTVGLGPALLTVAAFVCVMWIVRGMWALGVAELMISLGVAALATTALTSPMDRLIGTDGVIYQARDLGLEVAADISSDDEDAAVSAVPEEMSALLVDTFVRQPHQLVNYGRSFDGGECEQIYTEAVAMEPLPPDSRDPREHVRSCDEDAYDHADNPDPAQVIAILVLFPAGLLVLLLVLAITLSLWISVLLALAQGLKAIVALVIGVLPGRARGMLWRTAADLAVALALVAFASIFAVGFMVFIQAVFSNTGTYGWNLMMTLLLVDILLVVGIIMVWRYHKAFRRAGERLAQALASARPGGKATTLPDRSTALRDAAAVGGTIWGYRRLRGLGGAAAGGARGGVHVLSGGGAQHLPPYAEPPGRATPQPPEMSSRPPSSGPKPLPPGSGEPRSELPPGLLSVRGAIGPGTGKPGGIPMAAAVSAAKVAAAVATGGTSSAVVAGARMAGRAVGATQKAMTRAGQIRRARLIQRMVRESGGRTPALLAPGAEAVPLSRRGAAAAAASPSAEAVPLSRRGAAAAAASSLRAGQASHASSSRADRRAAGVTRAEPSVPKRRFRRVVTPDGQVVLVPMPAQSSGAPAQPSSTGEG